ncbi:hypothetical protein RHSIM_Rhsim05G0102400 [Rhododendron simsii]|uniref:Uncharacterized protein n=1 Tax=Rhododendron simsii TaxID=118357 RepID=A0A834H1F0_RHOSS|nr:hypothetical protein RHSIM_Rhsim05G0102400 [Rhododendron simsii]
MMARDRSILEKNLLHSAMDFAEVDIVSGVTMLGAGDGGLEGGVCGGEEKELPKMCYANCIFHEPTLAAETDADFGLEIGLF